MTRLLLCFSFLFITAISNGQQFKLKTADELISYGNNGWKQIKKLIDSAINKVDVLPVDTNQARDAVYEIQIEVNPQSPLGSIVYMTGGMIFENGWIRLLGSGSNRLTRSIATWNKGKTYYQTGEGPPYLLIADDALGGFFAINNGALGSDGGKIYYMAPATLQWQAMDMNILEFLNFLFNADYEEFYKPYMSKNWKFEIVNLPADKCYNFNPPLWSKEGKKFAKSVRKYIPCEEQYNFNMKMRREFGMEQEEEGH